MNEKTKPMPLQSSFLNSNNANIIPSSSLVQDLKLNSNPIQPYSVSPSSKSVTSLMGNFFDFFLFV